MTPEHTTADCTGRWHLISADGVRLLRCDVCSREYAATMENRLAAIDENYAGIYLDRLSREGALMIRRKLTE